MFILKPVRRNSPCADAMKSSTGDSTTNIEQSKCRRLDHEDRAEQDKEDLTQKNATSCGMQGQACKGEIEFY
jgi:hypothetical protein